MRTIIAGSRNVSQEVFDREIQHLRWKPSFAISGDARGVDRMGYDWAVSKGIPAKKMPAKWNNEQGYRDKTAGLKRNMEMASQADALFAIWDGKSPGTNHMIQVATKKGLMVQVCMVGEL